MKKSRKGIGNHNSYRGKASPSFAHGMTKTRPWYSWQHMRQRCDNKNDLGYKNYGGRGITYHENWSTFAGFWKDMKKGYKDNLTLERLDVNGNYSFSNCVWIPKSQQSQNTRKTIFVEFEGRKVKLFELAKRFGINYNTLYNRINRYGVPLKEALTTKSFLNGRKTAKEFLANLLK